MASAILRVLDVSDVAWHSQMVEREPLASQKA
jgi:hypothetical protein